MSKAQTQFLFDRHICMTQVAGTLLLARLATESLHGFDRVALEAAYKLNRRERCVVIDSMTDVGHSLALIFSGYCRREFGEGAIRVIAARNVQETGASR